MFVLVVPGAVCKPQANSPSNNTPVAFSQSLLVPALSVGYIYVMEIIFEYFVQLWYRFGILLTELASDRTTRIVPSTSQLSTKTASK